MRRNYLVILLACFIATVINGQDVAIAQDGHGDITAQQVREAIDKGVSYLKQQQKADGSWDDYPGYPGGTTALCTLAILNAGVELGDPQIEKALKYLRKFQPESTYVTSLQTMVFARAKLQSDLLLISRNVKWMESVQITEGDYKGAWSYPKGSGDNSNSQFALLALHEAQRAGVPVSERTWRLAQNYWKGCQNADGSWGYHKPMPGTGSMTCAGITSLVIAADRIQQPDAKVDNEKIICCQPETNLADDRGIDNGVNWLARNFSVRRNPGQSGGLWLLYYLYGMERAGRLTARRFIGEADWYREGAKFLVGSQDALSGYWGSSGNALESRAISTSFALLFLSKGRWPVLISKLKHDPDNDWNQHRHDLGNLTLFVESRWKQDLTWQEIDLRLADVDDLLQSPVLYLCGSASPLPENPAAAQKIAGKLRDYLDRGGFLFAEEYCSPGGFDKGFQELIKKIFPEEEYRLRLLEPEHPIWHAEEIIPAEQLRPLWGIDFGCRTSVVYAPLDPPENPRPSLSCLWELSRSGRDKSFIPKVQLQIDAALGLGVNILAYATNRELQSKEEHFQQTSRGPADQTQRGRLYIAKIRHPGGCNAAPRALLNLLELTGRELKIRATVRDQLLDLTDDALFDYHLVFMHGRNAFRFTDAERAQLKKYLERGGMLFADAICASQAFTESFRQEMALIFPQNKLQRIAADDPLWTTKYGGFDLSAVTRRDPSGRGANAPLSAVLKKAPPDLEGIRLGDRWAVVFSQYDISCALEKTNSLECRGYVREDAARIGVNVILYSLQQ